MLKKILIGVSLCVMAILIYAATLPTAFRYERSMVINAAPSQIFPLVNDLRRWPEWSPYEKMDPNMKKTLSDQTVGQGAWTEWDGNSSASKGRMEIIDSAADSAIVLRLDFVSPMAATNTATFSFSPEGDATRVSWAMSGENSFVAKLFSVFVDCEKMIGDAFTEGLSAMKNIAEKG